VGKVEVDPRGAWIIRISDVNAGCQDGRGDVAVGVQAALRAVVSALGESLGDTRPAQAVLAERGGVVPARWSRPPVASHSCLSAVTSMPGLNRAIRLPHNRAQVEIRQSSTVITLPCAATIRAATSRARACLARLAERDSPAWSERVRW
jgi:hypothetical protein